MTHIKNASSGYVYREITDLDALGNVVGSSIGNNALTQVQAFHPATGQMTQNTVTKTSGGSVVHELGYDYDGFSNLYQSEVTASNGLSNYETFDYDNLHRLDVSTRAYSSESRSNDVIDYSYSSLGNITKKDDYFSTASYGNAARNLGGNAGPNAIRQITYAWGGTTNYSYDDNGNMLTGDGRTMTYNEFNKPLTISKNGVTSVFSYGANLLRYKQVKSGIPGGTQTTYYVDKLLEIEKQGTRTTYRHYFDGVAILHKEVTGAITNWTMAFNLKDRLGSIVTLADESGNVLEHRSYDPFGKPRRGDFIDAPPMQLPRVAPITLASSLQLAIQHDPHPEFALDPLTDRGFTDHEHLDEQQIIHMNGRVFDYNIGRFSSVDIFIQGKGNSQSINPYSYILNNPMAGVDPSGYAAKKLKEETDVKSESVAITGSRLKTGTKVSDGNGNSVTKNGYGQIVGGTGSFSTKDGVIQLGNSNTVEISSFEENDVLEDEENVAALKNAFQNELDSAGPGTAFLKGNLIVKRADGRELTKQDKKLVNDAIRSIRKSEKGKTFIDNIKKGKLGKSGILLTNVDIVLSFGPELEKGRDFSWVWFNLATASNMGPLIDMNSGSEFVPSPQRVLLHEFSHTYLNKDDILTANHYPEWNGFQSPAIKFENEVMEAEDGYLRECGDFCAEYFANPK